jgi:hypothetical protein
MIDGEASLATRAAWLYFAAGLRQSEVADRLNIQSTKAHRLIARASRESMIRVFVEGSVAECVALENALTQRFSLALCRVAPDLGDRELPLKALALEGASFGIRVNSVNPDAVLRGSKIWAGEWRQQRAASNKVSEDQLDEVYRQRSLLKRSVYPEDIAEAVYFFASDLSAKSTGNILNVDAGNAQAYTR